MLWQFFFFEVTWNYSGNAKVLASCGSIWRHLPRSPHSPWPLGSRALKGSFPKEPGHGRPICDQSATMADSTRRFPPQQLVGGWPTPKNMSQLGWWHCQLNGNIKKMFQTTNQIATQHYASLNIWYGLATSIGIDNQTANDWRQKNVTC